MEFANVLLNLPEPLKKILTLFFDRILGRRRVGLYQAQAGGQRNQQRLVHLRLCSASRFYFAAFFEIENCSALVELRKATGDLVVIGFLFLCRPDRGSSVPSRPRSKRTPITK